MKLTPKLKLKLLYKDKTRSGLNFRFPSYRICRKVLQYEEYSKPCQISLTIVSEREMRRLNRQFRQIDKTTDVLSFPMGDYDYDENAVILGDIVICAETALRQAAEYGHSVKRELTFLVVHGMLHLLGYDHIDKEDEEVMFGKQKDIMSELAFLDDNRGKQERS